MGRKTTTSPATPAPGNGRQAVVRRVAVAVGVALVAALVLAVLRCCCVGLVEIPGEGARPVFLPGDRVAVNKTAYGLRLWPMRRWGHVRWGAEKPQKGEWMAFNDPAAAADGTPDEAPVFVAYCQALPGDSLWVDSAGGVHLSRPATAAGKTCRAVELPRKNAYVAITPDNVRWYAATISRHEGAKATVRGDSLFVDGQRVQSFRFSHDYYWVAAANPRGGADSRTFGFVPDTHLIGRLTRVVYSWDREAPWYARLRFRRMMMRVGREQV